MDEVIEAMARAMEKSLAWDIENDVYAGEMTHEERCKVAQAAITTIEPMIRAQVEREIVEWLREQDGHGYDDMRANLIEAGEHRRHSPDCAVVRNGNLRAWCDCGKGDG